MSNGSLFFSSDDLFLRCLNSVPTVNSSDVTGIYLTGVKQFRSSQVYQAETFHLKTTVELKI